MIKDFLKQYSDKLENANVYFYVRDKKYIKQLYQCLLDSGIEYYNDSDPHSEIEHIPLSNIVRITDNRERYKRYSKNIKKMCFNVTYPTDEKNYKKGLFAVEQYEYFIINFQFLLRKEKIKELKNSILLK
jgi:hypothetical protein